MPTYANLRSMGEIELHSGFGEGNVRGNMSRGNISRGKCPTLGIEYYDTVSDLINLTNPGHICFSMWI